MSRSIDLTTASSVYNELLGEHDLLPENHTFELIARAQAGDKQAEEELIRHNQGLVQQWAGRLVALYAPGPGVDIMDCIQAGNMGLLKAIKKFDLSRGLRFSTYAVWWIRQGIGRELENMGRTVRIPVARGRQVAQLMRAHSDYVGQHGKSPSHEQLAEALGWAVETVVTVAGSPVGTVSFELVNDGGEEFTLLRVLSNDSDTEREALNHILSQDLEELIDTVPTLTERERYVLKRLFGWSNRQADFQTPSKVTLEQVSNELDMSRERVRQIRKSGVEKLRRHMLASMDYQTFAAMRQEYGPPPVSAEETS